MRASERNKGGFSIVMVLVAAALLGLLALGFSEMIGGAMKGQKNVQNAVDFDTLKTSINMVLSTRACDGAFKDSAGNNVTMSFGTGLLSLSPPTNLLAPGTSFAIEEIYQGNTLIAKNGANLGGGMKISKLEFTDAIYDGEQTLGTPGVTYKAFVATLNVEATKVAGSYGNQSPKKTFSVRLLLRPNAGNTAGTVERCSSSSSALRVQMITASSTGSPTTVSCPSGMKVVSCTTIQAPLGQIVCGTAIDSSGERCLGGGCTPMSAVAPGQSWATTALCADLSP